MKKTENQYGVWTGYFAGQYSYERLKNAAKSYADYFLATVHLSDDNSALDDWVMADESQNMLTILTADIQAHIKSVSAFALPAHDLRQILLKDVAEGLRFYQMEKPQGFKSCFMIPMMAHDPGGRLLEGRFYNPDTNPHENWIPHSQLSYLLLKAILDKPDYRDMPQALKNHFLYAVAAHSGDNGKTFMSRAVQTCDRMQLIGPEGFFRALSYVVCLMEKDIQYPVSQNYEHDLPEMKDHTSVLSLLEYFSRNMRENICRCHAQRQRRVAIENVAILMMACHDNERLKNKIFAPEMNTAGPFGQHKQKIPCDIMIAANNLYTLYSNTYAMRPSQFEATCKIFQLLQDPNGSAHLNNRMKIQMNRAMEALMPDERQSLYQALCFAERLRAEQDECDRIVISSIEENDPKFIQLMAKEATLYCSQPHGQDLINLANHNQRPFGM